MKNTILILAIALITFNACNEKQQITNQKDYSNFLSLNQNNKIQNTNEQIEFWLAKENNNPTTIFKTKLAGLYASKYKLTGEAQLLLDAQKLLEEVNISSQEKNAGILRMLASHSITQHEFAKAYQYAEKALEIKDDQFASKLISFDACMELGFYDQAINTLSSIKNKDNFDYMVRLSKWNDYKGNLDNAVQLMEDAKAKISPNDNTLKVWANSNLADMYGHQGKIEKSYNAYLEVLEIDPNYFYALKGIAYIAYAKDKDYQGAKQILNFLDKNHPIPDYKLMLSEIASLEGETEKADKLTETFYSEVSKPVYGNMYNKYILEIELDKNNFDKAIIIAENEVKHRATPQTYDLLAWTYFQAGKKQEAVEIAEMFVENKTFEPDASFHLAFVYEDTHKEKAHNYLLEAEEAAFELGPSATLVINEALNRQI